MQLNIQLGNMTIVIDYWKVDRVLTPDPKYPKEFRNTMVEKMIDTKTIEYDKTEYDCHHKPEFVTNHIRMSKSDQTPVRVTHKVFQGDYRPMWVDNGMIDGIRHLFVNPILHYSTFNGLKYVYEQHMRSSGWMRKWMEKEGTRAFWEYNDNVLRNFDNSTVYLT